MNNMKHGILTALAIILAGVAPCWAVPDGAQVPTQTAYVVDFRLTLTQTGTGTTTVASGNSPMWVNGTSQTIDISRLPSGLFSVQLEGPSGVTPSSANARAAATAGWESGVSFNLGYRTSNLDTSAAWSGASIYWIGKLNNIANSGNTLWAVTVDDVDWKNYMQFVFQSGITQYGEAKFVGQAR